MRGAIRSKRMGAMVVALILLGSILACGQSLEGVSGESSEGQHDTIITLDKDGNVVDVDPASPAEDPDPDSDLAPHPDPDQDPIAGGEHAWGDILSGGISSGDGFTGRGVLNVTVTNPDDEEAEIVLPPGFVFLPPEGSGEQRLMVIKEERATLDPGEEIVMDPYVVCIDSGASSPSSGTGYSPGGLVGNLQLRELAICLNAQDLSDSDDDLLVSMMLQMAIWEVSDGYSADEMLDLLENPEDLSDDALGQAVPAEMMEMMRALIEIMPDSSLQFLAECSTGAGE